VLVGSYTIKTIFIGITVAFVIIILGFKIVKTKISKKDLICNINIKINEKNVKTKAMIDTGNLLKEPITNIPVAVVEHTLLYDVMPKEILNNMDKILGGDMQDIPEDIQNQYISKLKVIPFSSLGKQNGMLLGVKVDNITVESDEGNKTLNKVIMGIYNKSLTKRGEYRALVGLWAN
ncbi:MAG: sigma-E processing peptidase SpoIIGA, partial [Clostridia bacterium]|nr:sigma-E processing peptidase SpoIIGA [Clostridia bacterium]